MSAARHLRTPVDTDDFPRQIDDDACRRFQWALELIGRRWSSGILLAIGRGAERFSEIRASVMGLSDRLLAQRLRELEAADLVERVVIPTTPVQIRYRLTERGHSLICALQPVVAWGQRWGELPADELRSAG